MNSESESLNPKRSAQRLAVGGNCVVARRCGEQPEADSQSTTSVNSIRPATLASLLVGGEASCRTPAHLFHSHPALKDEGRRVGGGWRWNVRKGSWLTIETRSGEDGHKPRCGSQSVHSSDEASNDRGAKGCRKVKTTQGTKKPTHWCSAPWADRTRDKVLLRGAWVECLMQRAQPNENGKSNLWNPVSRIESGGDASQEASQPLTDWRAGCGRSASPVRRGERHNSMCRSYLYVRTKYHELRK